MKVGLFETLAPIKKILVNKIDYNHHLLNLMLTCRCASLVHQSILAKSNLSFVRGIIVQLIR